MIDPTAAETVVIGLGSPLMADDGLGIAALERLRERWTLAPEVELIDGGTWGMNLLHLIEAARCVVLIDAIDVGAAPGASVELERDALPRFLGGRISPHQVDLRDVLALAELRGTLPERIVAIGLQPARVELAARLSPTLASRIDVLVRRVVDRLESWGHRAQHRPAAIPHA